MDGIIVNINPVLFSIGHFEIRWYTVIIMLAIAAAVVIAIFGGKRKGISPDQITSLAPWVIIGGLIGARLFHVIDKWGYYVGHPFQILMVQQGGLAIWGGLAGGLIAVIIFTRSKHISTSRLLDLLVPALLAAEIIGRFACIINGDAYGSPTTLPWGFIYINPGSMIPADMVGIPTHPYPVYEMLWNTIGLLVVLRFRRYLKKDGLLFLSYLLFYAVGRLLLTTVRQENVWFWGMQEAQVVSIAILIISAGIIVYLVKKSKQMPAQKALN